MNDALFREDRRQYRDRRIPQALLPLLARMKVRAIGEPFVVVSLPPGNGPEMQAFLASRKKLPFSSFTGDDRGATVILPGAVWKKAEARFPEAEVERGFRVLAVEGEADWNTPGFLPVLGRALAEGNVGAGILSGFRRLHLLVKARHMKDARVFLDLLTTQARGRLQQTRPGPRDE